MRVVAMNMNMRSWMLVVTLVILLLEQWGSLCHGCWEDERNALLQIMSAFNHPRPSYGLKSSWGIDDADCCNWYTVGCNETTKRVTKLYLEFIMDLDSKGWYLNASLFLPFKDLNILRLRGNQILGCIENEGFEKLSNLTNLEELDLDLNKFNNSIMSSLRSLSSLKMLSLYQNKLNGIIDMQDLNHLASLEYLDLGSNEIEGFKSFRELNALSQLETLSLRGNEIAGFMAAGENKSSNNISELWLQEINTNASHVLELQSLLGSFPNLKALDLGANNLRGTSFDQGSHHMNNVEELNLDYSSVDENFLQSLGALVSLKSLSMRRLNGSLLVQGLCELNQLQELDISESNLNGTLPSCIANLTFIRKLDLSHNHFQIPMTLSPFFNHTKLHCLYAEGNNIFSETEQHSLVPKFQLAELSLSGYGYSGKFPKFLYYQHKLQYIHLSDIRMSGGFPHWLLENNTDLITLLLVNSSLSGELCLPRHSHTSLRTLDISENYLRGHVPAQIGAHFPNIQLLNMSGNSFIGRIPLSLGNMSSILYLDLSNNRLSGEVPGQLAISCLMLEMLVLSNNSLQGQIFPRNWQLRNLLSLQMDDNFFTGTIPDSLYNSSSLRILKLSHNNLQGTLPDWIGNMSALQVLDLSENNISGSLPPNFPLGIIQVYLPKNRLQGSLENAFYNISSLVALDLRHNYFTGNIPKWVETLPNLRYLLLSNNNFEGEIPIQLCNLDGLGLIDFSHNYLLGHIPSCLRSESTWDITNSFRSLHIIYGPGGKTSDRDLGFIVNSPFELHV